MKKLLSVLLTSFIFLSSLFCQKTLPFTKGVNLLDYFELWEYKQDFLPYVNRYDEDDFECMKNMGVDVIRLPVHFDLLMEPKYTGKISETILEKLDKVCDWAEKNKIYLVIDDHSYNGESWASNPPSIKNMREHLISVWTQISSRYSSRSEYIIYEIINEPPYKTGNDWYKLQKEIVNLIRTKDSNRTVVVSSIDFSSIDTLIRMKPLEDNNLIYAFHYYEPHLFTHQGATWMGPGFETASGIPFPYDKSRFPKLKAPENSWFKQLITEYPQTGTVKYMENRVKKVVDWAVKNNVAIWCGELGVQCGVQNEDRPEYNRILTEILSKYSIPYCIWGLDYQCGFFCKEEKGMLFPNDIDRTTVESYRFKMPSDDFVLKTNSVIKSFPQNPYVIYDGNFGKWTDFQTWGWGNIRNVVDNSEHKECLKVTYSEPNSGPDIKFTPPAKVIEEVEKNHDSLNFKLSVKFTSDKQEFTIHFKDTDEGSALPPWQYSYTVKASNYPKNEWVSIELPLIDFRETGAWSDVAKKWFNPFRKFDWQRLDKICFEFYNNDKKFEGDIYIDDIVLKSK